MFTFQLSFSGSPCIYYGDEIGLTGGQDPLCRKCMVWEKEKQDRDLFAHVQTLISLRKQYRALRFGEFHVLETNDETNHIAYVKTYDDETIVCVLNNGEAPLEWTVPFSLADKTVTNLWTNEQMTEQTMTIEPYGFRMLLVQATSAE